ncbi:MAG: glycosyltransferase [Bacteroides sp.]|nr:glycosyltransferase [Roseburia sp.]MCM1346918.1 glycosyltransferase [Bacteroides sp.]MCM1421449.1 glycosyltransferase [Bacteroides sp.]
MKKVLYISNIEVPYRTIFFNDLSEKCDLTVLYERQRSTNRDSKWVSSEVKKYTVRYLNGCNIGNENSFSFSVFKYLHNNWDVIIIGCYNSKVQMMAMLYMRILGIPFYINLDGEPFIKKNMKGFLKSFFLRGAKGFFVAGEQTMKSLRNIFDANVKVFPYYFSSLTNAEIEKHSLEDCLREDFVLVVGQYFDYKGMDIAFNCACLDTTIRYKFVGMGNRTTLFRHDMGFIPSNVELIPFLQKKELFEEYKKCRLLLLPTCQECWGLVVNEAASFGTPIVSTWGSGAAVEFIGDDYPQYLAISGNVKSILKCLNLCMKSDNTNYGDYLRNKSKKYSIENMVDAHVKVFEC